MASEPPSSLYDEAEIYDIAFDFRDIPFQCEVLEGLYARHQGGRRPESFLDVCCGPGYHCMEFARRGRRAVGLDLSSAMLAHARAKALRQGIAVDLVEADMCDFHLAQPVDLVFCALASFHELLTNEDLLRHLRAVAANLRPGGLYIIEGNHPSTVFGLTSPVSSWEQVRGDITVRARWATSNDPFDPILQQWKRPVRIEVERDGQQSLRELVHTHRALTHQELKLLIALSGVFEAVEWLGDLDLAVPFDNSEAAWRMVAVLRRTA